MPQNPADIKSARDFAGKYGRINASEYSRLTGTPAADKETPAQRQTRKRVVATRSGAGRINASEYKALQTKATKRKRVAGK
jgi:hypothetical protein